MYGNAHRSACVVVCMHVPALVVTLLSPLSNDCLELSLPILLSTDGQTDGRADRLAGRAGRQAVYGRQADRWTDGRPDGQADGRTERRTDGWAGEQKQG